MGEMISVFREEHFNAAHRLNNPSWSDSKNKEVFGKCNLPNYHGHNYILIVKVTGEIDENTRMDRRTQSSTIVGLLARLDRVRVTDTTRRAARRGNFS